MQEDPDDARLTDLLTRLRFTPPPLEAVWATDRPSRRFAPSWIALAVSFAAILVLSVGAVAATGGWFNDLQPNGECFSGDPTCGDDYTQVSIIVDHTIDLTEVNVLVKPGVSSARLSEIGAAVVKKNPGHRVIVYLLSDLPPGQMDAGFAGPPGDDAAAAPSVPANLAPYWLMTYDSGPDGVRETRP